MLNQYMLSVLPCFIEDTDSVKAVIGSNSPTFKMKSIYLNIIYPLPDYKDEL